VGFSVVSRYKSTLSTSMTSAQTTVPVSSITTFDGHTLTMADLGTEVFLTVEPGSAREEITKCTSISSLSWAGCTRGLAFYGTSTAAVTANQKAHNAGSVVVMSNVHYVYEELADKDSAETIGGIKTFSNFPSIATSTALPTADGQFATKRYADTVGAGGFTSLNASTTQAIKVNGTAPETIGVAVSSTGGIQYSPIMSASTSLQLNVSSTRGLAVDVNGLYIKTSSTLINFDNGSLAVVASSTAVSNTIPITNASGTLNYGFFAGPKFGGDGSDGALSVGAGTTTTIALGNAKVVVKNYTSLTLAGHVNFTGSATTGTLVIFKVQGTCNFTGFIHATSTGAIGGAGAAVSNSSGNDGTTPLWWIAPGKGIAGTGSAAGAAGTTISLTNSYTDFAQGLYPFASMGAGGGSGGGNNGTSGAGGIGGGAFVLECAGTNHTLTGTVNANGQTAFPASGTNAGGSGGGGGGYAGVFYNGTETGTPTLNVAGGLGSAAVDGGGSCGAGSGGGGVSGPGVAGGNCGADTGNGGAGGPGASAFSKNYWYF
jgi:hypothetical protein